MDDDEIFERRMASLGVEPLEGRGTGRQRHRDGGGFDEGGEEDERRVFEEAMRRLEVPAAAAGEASARSAHRVRRVKARARGERVDERVDLHGLNAGEALHRLESFVAEAAGAGAGTVLVITGKGHHSPGGRGVLKRRVEEWIHGRGRLRVRAFADAPRSLGGRGAYLLYLRRAAAE